MTDCLMDYQQIIDILPHRPPLLLVDRVIELQTGPKGHIHATKCISGLDPYFAGHFPGNPLLPGVYIIEGLAQASAILCFKSLYSTFTEVERKCVLTGIDEAKFRRPVVPGDVLHYYAQIERSRGSFCWMTCSAKVDGEVVAEAKLSAMVGSPPVKKATP